MSDTPPPAPPAETEPPAPAPPAAPQRPRGKAVRWVSAVGCVLAVLLGLGIYTWLVENPTTAERRTPQVSARLVEVIVAEAGDHAATLTAMGQAMPATQVELRAELGGRVVWISPELVPGGRFRAGEEVLRIDPADPTLLLAQRESEVLQAEGDVVSAQAGRTAAERELAIETGNQRIAEREVELLGDDVPEGDRSLVLRRPQLLAAEAAVESAQAAVLASRAAQEAAESRREQARVDLDRATVRAPFNAVVMARDTDTGDLVAPTTDLAAIVGTDRAWVELALPVADLRWIDLPRTGPDGERSGGSPVQIRNPAAWGPDRARDGRVIRLLPALDAQARMARLLVEVDDPLALDAGEDADAEPPLLMGSFVQAAIGGRTLSSVVRLPRAAVWNGDEVRVMNDADELEVRRVTIAFVEPDHVLVSEGIEAGDRVVTTNLSAAVDGLPLRVAGDTASPDTAPAAERPR